MLGRKEGARKTNRGERQRGKGANSEKERVGVVQPRKKGRKEKPHYHWQVIKKRLESSRGWLCLSCKGGLLSSLLLLEFSRQHKVNLLGKDKSKERKGD